MPQKLWEADFQTKSKSNLFQFEKFLAKKFNFKPNKNYKKLYNFRQLRNQCEEVKEHFVGI